MAGAALDLLHKVFGRNTIRVPLGYPGDADTDTGQYPSSSNSDLQGLAPEPLTLTELACFRVGETSAVTVGSSRRRPH